MYAIRHWGGGGVSRYVGDVSRSVFNMMTIISQDSAKRPKLNIAEAELIDQVAAKKVTVGHFAEELNKHIDKVDYECGLDYAAAHGNNTTEAFFIQPIKAPKSATTVVHPCFSLTLLNG